MKTFWKLLGAAALVAGLTPYKVEKDEETGENSYQSLLLRVTSTPTGEANKREININLGEGTLTEKLFGKLDQTEEPHLFSDELCVEYTGEPVTEPAAPETPIEAEAPAEPAEPEAPAEAVPAEAAAEENKEEA